jgi:hypothetical protein
MTNQTIDGPYVVPEISDEELKTGLARFTPLVLSDHGLMRIALPDPRMQSFLWSPKFIGDEVEIEEILSIYTNHTCAYYGFFKPTLAEVIAQIPKDIDPRINAFYITDDPVDIFRDGNGHRAKTILGILKERSGYEQS